MKNNVINICVLLAVFCTMVHSLPFNRPSTPAPIEIVNEPMIKISELEGIRNFLIDLYTVVKLNELNLIVKLIKND